MAFLSGRRRRVVNPPADTEPLDPYLPRPDVLKPSLLWRVAESVPIILALLVTSMLVADRWHLLPPWIPSSMDLLLKMFNEPFTLWRWGQQVVVISIILLVGVLLAIYSIARLRRRTRGVRAHPRRPLSAPVEVSWKYSPSLECHSHGRSLDVSDGGLKIELPDPLNVSERIRFRFYRGHLAGTASVRYCNRVGRSYLIGVKFRHLSA